MSICFQVHYACKKSGILSVYLKIFVFAGINYLLLLKILASTQNYVLKIELFKSFAHEKY